MPESFQAAIQHWRTGLGITRRARNAPAAPYSPITHVTVEIPASSLKLRVSDQDRAHADTHRASQPQGAHAHVTAHGRRAVQVGGRSTVSSTIKQIVEIRADEDERFARLLEILGQHVEDTKVLVFVNSQEKASSLFQQLLNYGYPNQMLHGDMQQVRTPTPPARRVRSTVCV